MDTTPLPRTASQDIPAPPRNRRAFPRHRAHGSARFQPNALGLGPYCEATMVDICEDGVGLTTSKALAAGAVITVVLSIAAGRRLESKAEVRWCAELADKRFRVGCRWHKRLNYCEMQQFC